MKVYSLGSTVFKVGQNAQENWDLVRECLNDSSNLIGKELGKELGKEFLWLHLDEFPSAHVVILHEEPSHEEINYACELVIQHSKHSRFSKKIIYTKIKNLKLGPDVGSVIFRKFDECKYKLK
jgi:predicted ribosome quality control (RQC) complex YloA/Tae2 family protein